ncbi:MAG: phosphoribosyltransferase [Thermotogae bacterium]|nr:phosphoribosyltransferase [Thermotogota bacterium]
MRLYKDRYSAGKQLLEKIKELDLAVDIVVAIPRGGVVVAEPIAEGLKVPLRTVGVKKLAPLEYPEMGFGAIAVDGSVVVNEGYMNLLGVDSYDLEFIKTKALEEALQKHRRLGGVKPDEVRGKNVLVVDDGLATGYTVLAAAECLKNWGARELVLAVPVAPPSACRLVSRQYDRVICLVVADEGFFAVGNYYKDFHQLSDDEVLSVLQKFQ